MKLIVKLVLIAIVAVVAIGIIAFFAIKHYSKSHIVDGPGMVYESPYKVYETEDVLALSDWLGKSEAELGLEKEYINDSNTLHSVAFNGKLFGAPADGSVNFRSSSDDGKNVASTLYIFSYDLGYDDCKEKLIEKYGEFEYENEEPYVESLGGCVTTCVFKADGKRIKLESASERNYIYVSIDEMSGE